MNKIKKSTIYIITILICTSSFLIILYINKIYPFGNEILGKSDAIVQFKPMLYNFIMKIKTSTLLNYSFNNGLGNPLIFDFIYYYSSPLNLIALLFKNYNAMYLSATLLKIIITSICMTFYVKSKTNNPFIIIIITISYIFSGWFLIYYYYLPWLDIFMIFPLFQYGLEKLLEEHKYHIYIFTLAYATATNFYLCFAICIYALLYFIIYTLLYRKDSFKKKLLTFDYIALSTIVSFVLAFFYLYILYDCIIKTSSFTDSAIINKYSITIFDFIKSLFYTNTIFTVEDSSTFPNICCSLLLLFPFFYFFINNNINKRIKIFSILSIIIIIAIIFIPQLDFIINAFHNIRGLTYRYSFIIIFLYIKMVLYCICNYDYKDKKRLLLTIIPIVILYLSCIKVIDSKIIVINITFFICYLIIILFYKNNKVFKLLILTIFLLESLVALNINIPMKVSNDEPIANFNKANTKYRLAKMGLDVEYNNINLYYNAKVTHLMTSMTYNRVIKLFKSIGCDVYENTGSACYENEAITNLLFNVKNDLYLEKIYAVDNNIKDTILSEYDVKLSQENIIKNMTNIDNIFEKRTINGKLNNNKYTYQIDDEYYILEDGNTSYIEIANELTSSNKVKTLDIYTVNEKQLKKVYNYLSKNQIKYTYYNDNHIKGTINVDKNQLIFTSIPYDKDWIVKIDNKKIKPIMLLDSLLGIETTPGKHTIELEYKTHYLIPVIVSISTLVLLIIDIIRKRKLT